jgi:hypothetical protein
MRNHQVMPDGAHGNETVGRGPDRHLGPACRSIDVGGLEKHVGREGRFDDREREDRLTGDRKRPLVFETLENFLNDWQRSDDIVDVGDFIDTDPRGLRSTRKTCAVRRRAVANSVTADVPRFRV